MSQTSPSPIAFFEPAILPTITDQEKGVACKPITSIVRGRRKLRYVPHHYIKDEVKATRAEIRKLLEPHAPDTPFDQAVTCRILWVWPWRKSEPKKNRIHGIKICDTKPDCGNLAKALEDIMEDLGYFTNDSRIGHPEMIKAWGDIPGLGVEIIPIRVIPPSFSKLQHIQEFGSIHIN